MINRIDFDEVKKAVVDRKQQNDIQQSERTKAVRTQIIIDLLAIANKEYITKAIVNQKISGNSNIIIHEIIYKNYIDFDSDLIFNDKIYYFELLLNTPIYQLSIDHKKLICNHMNLSILEIISAIIPKEFYLHTLPGNNYDNYVHKIYISRSKTPITDPCGFSLCCDKNNYYCFCTSCLLDNCFLCCCFVI